MAHLSNLLTQRSWVGLTSRPMTQGAQGAPPVRREGAARRAAREPAKVRASDPRPLKTIPETAEYLRVSPWQVYKLIRTGHLRAVMVGEVMRVHPADLDTYLGRAS